jgi:predicted DNA-binding protein YlxM (UPF0122 family)
MSGKFVLLTFAKKLSPARPDLSPYYNFSLVESPIISLSCLIYITPASWESFHSRWSGPVEPYLQNKLGSMLVSCLTVRSSTMFDNVRQCLTMFDNVRQCSTMFNNVQQCSTMFDNVRQCSTMFNNVRQCSTMFDNVRQCSTMFNNVRQCSAMFDNVRQYSTMFDNSTLFDNVRQFDSV